MSNFNLIPMYKSHKVVRAFQINYIKVDPDDKSGGAMIVPIDRSLPDFPVEKEYIDKHNPQKGGYFIVYNDGYLSYSPASAFEPWHTRM